MRQIVLIILISMYMTCGVKSEQVNSGLQDIPGTTHNLEGQESVTATREVDKLVFYADVFSIIVGSNTDSKTFGVIEPTEWLVYRSHTVQPYGLDQLGVHPSLSQTLLRNFVNENTRTEGMIKKYATHSPVQPFSGNTDPARFFAEARAKYPRTRAAVSVSKVGMESDFSKGLVYVEYFHPDVGPKRFYILISKSARALEIEKPSGGDGGFDKFEIIPVN